MITSITAININPCNKISFSVNLVKIIQITNTPITNANINCANDILKKINYTIYND